MRNIARKFTTKKVPSYNQRSRANQSAMFQLEKILLCIFSIASVIGCATNEKNAPQPSPAIKSSQTKDSSGGIVLLHEVHVNASKQQVWEAFTTEAGWASWAAPVVKIDLKAGGTIKTNYNSKAKIGDAGTNTLHILNYVPLEILTLQAELADNWPSIMKEDAKDLMNVILFKTVGPNITKIESYGLGYRDTPQYKKLLEFFIPANEGLFKKLIATLEKPADE